MVVYSSLLYFFFSSRRRHTRCALVTGVQTCALPIYGRLLPYYARRAIDAGALAGRGLELLWLDHPIDAFLLHVQGSGRVDLPDGSVVRVGFAGHNGRPYASIGRALIERGELSADQASWPDIRAWIDASPDKAADLLAVNPRYIFRSEEPTSELPSLMRISYA